jgi:hypothetical protein
LKKKIIGDQEHIYEEIHRVIFNFSDEASDYRLRIEDDRAFLPGPESSRGDQIEGVETEEAE